MTPVPSDGAWIRVGELLIRRRIELDPSYRHRNVFADAKSLNWRLLYDIETGRRTRFKAATLAAIEAAYVLAPGSIHNAAAGGDLIPLPARAERPRYEDPALQRIADDPDLPPDVKDAVLMLAMNMLARRRAESGRAASA